jgi:hypothetical protein
LLAVVIATLSFAGIFAGLTMLAVLRAMRYRRELTKLTAAQR